MAQPARAPSRPFDLLDWRRRVGAIYAGVRGHDDPGEAHAQWCAARDDLLRTHAESPIPLDGRGSFAGVPVAPYDPAFRFVVPVDTDVSPDRIDVDTGTDGVVSMQRVGIVVLGDLGRLDVWWHLHYGGGIFVPLKDALAGARTYGGGRYLLDTCKGADLGAVGDSLVIDCNFAYNPSCAYDPAWACPLAPPGNTVTSAAPVGELLAAVG